MILKPEVHKPHMGIREVKVHAGQDSAATCKWSRHTPEGTRIVVIMGK